MAENRDRAREYDAVLGGQNPPPIDAAILGGIEGVKRRLASPDLEMRVAALSDALKYGETGLDLVIQALHDESKQVQFTAYSLLKDRTELKVEQHLNNVLSFFEFDAIEVNKFGKEISRRPEINRYFAENLSNGIFLQMVLIPGGTFRMGSPETEKKRQYSESPQHKVKVSSFFMGKYLVTQAQWKVVAALPQVNISLNSDPSCFKGANLPVERVTWYEAVEFCARLSQKTGRNYRLPTEAEWEYACRAGTTTPFYFGQTITTELANYNGEKTYASEPQGTYRNKTTPVGSFAPNAFGLYDMHGNVWEWCADSWHEHYRGAPSDGSVWESDFSELRVLRGGSWIHYPADSRSAFRNCNFTGAMVSYFGFRVACSAA